MQIFTSSWFEPLPPSILEVGISRGTPRGYPAGYRKLMKLAPGSWFKSVSPEEYHRRFAAQLAALDARAVIDELEAMSHGGDVALLCYEDPRKASDWCHRGQVSAWFFDETGIEVFEFGFEVQGCGHHHPKLPQMFRTVLT